MNNITVINIKGMVKDSYTYIGRGSVLGNPYYVKQYGREQSIAFYKKLLWSEICCLGPIGKEIMKLAASSNDLVLGCYCKPLPCHGDVVKAAILWVRSQA